MVHYIQAVMSDATHILAMVQAHSPDRLSRLTGFILVARTLDEDGTLRTHTLKLEDQSAVTTDRLLADCERLIRE